jgi:hypothetical protein
MVSRLQAFAQETIMDRRSTRHKMLETKPERSDTATSALAAILLIAGTCAVGKAAIAYAFIPLHIAR